MTSSSSAYLALEAGQTRSLQPGALIQRRGVQEVAKILYPKGTVAHLISSQPPTVVDIIGNGSKKVIGIFNPSSTTAQSFVSNNIVHQNSPVNILVFPYPGVYRVRAEIPWSGTVSNGQIEVSINYRDLAGTEVSRTGVVRIPQGYQVVSLEIVAQMTSIVSVATTLVGNGITLTRYAQTGGDSETTFNVEYLGAL